MSVITIPGASTPPTSTTQPGSAQAFNTALNASPTQSGPAQGTGSTFHASILAWCPSYSDPGTNSCGVNTPGCSHDANCQTYASTGSCAIDGTGHCIQNNPSCPVADGCGAYGHNGGCAVNTPTGSPTTCAVDATNHSCSIKSSGSSPSCTVDSSGGCSVNNQCPSNNSGNSGPPTCSVFSNHGCSADSAGNNSPCTVDSSSGSCAANTTGSPPACTVDSNHTCAAYTTACVTDLNTSSIRPLPLSCGQLAPPTCSTRAADCTAYRG